ncbi:MAG: hypothetical protein GF421_04485 [Candidatus Aminicenantes bacterium]|nr:hypothetical protein [Candidatus Aminicenantes bacterium]
MKAHQIRILVLSLFLFSILNASPQQKPKRPWDGNRTVPVHNIWLKDGFNEKIIPTESYPLPYSTKYTCAPCHNYSQIQNGLHFNPLSSGQDGRPGEPWVWVDPDTGTALPVSFRNWPGVFHPQELGLTFWQFTLLFGRHMAGGKVSEPELEEQSPESRWNVSGPLEINCLACHNNSRKQSHSEWAYQVLRQNFRWAATASSGMGEVGGMASRLSKTWDIYDGPNPDDSQYAVAPYVRYDRTQFNSKHEVFMDINHQPDDDRCLVCHSVSPASQTQFLAEKDAHTAAGVQCVDCHRNDISHAMIRGYEGESQHTNLPLVSEFTCRGCHLREKTPKSKIPSAGRLGAPYPFHKKIPPVHLEKLSCTACHSGSLPKNSLTQVQTSKAHRLGIYGIARWDLNTPVIQEPVFIRDSNGRLTPHRLMWPSYWGWIQNNKVSPLNPDLVQKTAGLLLKPESKAADILSALAQIPELKANPVLICSDQLYSLNWDGGLNASEYSGEPFESPMTWALRTDRSIIPLIPEFDPKTDPLDRDIEYRIQDTLETLNTIQDPAGSPALVYKNRVFEMSDGYLENREWKGEAQEAPRLCWLQEDEMIDLIPEFELNTMKETIGYPERFTEEQVKKILLTLSVSPVFEQPETKSKAQRKYVFISSGQMYQINDNGSLEAAKHPAAEPVFWPLAHQVRPAQQSLGINGCSDCHSVDSKFFFAQISGQGPIKSSQTAQRSAHSFMGLGWAYQKLFGLSFLARPLLKIALAVIALLIAGVIMLQFFKTLGYFTGLYEKRR